jgi:hypothetical protein
MAEGPRRAPRQGGPWPPAPWGSQHRDRADVACLQLAGHREGGEQGHQARLLDGLAAAADGYRDACPWEASGPWLSRRRGSQTSRPGPRER